MCSSDCSVPLPPEVATGQPTRALARGVVVEEEEGRAAQGFVRVLALRVRKESVTVTVTVTVSASVREPLLAFAGQS